ncbi:MAG: class I SAM-dependent methyltransferase [bacterium]
MNVRCNQCRSSRSQLISIENGFRIVKCCDCGLVYVNPQPEERDLMEFYQHYFPEDEGSPLRWELMMRPVFDEVHQYILHNYSNGRLLDVGCSYGFFLERFDKTKWEIFGVDPSGHAVTYARKKLGKRIFTGSLIQQDFPDQFFDIITLFYVLEHVVDPLSFLKELHRILKPKGLLVLRIPHSEPIIRLAKLFRLDIPLLYPPMHLYDFSPNTLKLILKKAGFRKISVEIGECTRMERFFQRALLNVITRFSIVLSDVTKRIFLMPGLSKTAFAIRS